MVVIMYIILVYDILSDENGARISRNIFKTCKKYLFIKKSNKLLIIVKSIFIIICMYTLFILLLSYLSIIFIL